MNANGAAPVALKVDGTGTTRELEVLTTYSASATHQPEANNVVSFGELDANGEFTKVIHEYVITRIARTSDGFNLDLQEYNEAIYNPGTIPAYKPLVNNTPVIANDNIPPDSVTHEELDQAVTAVNGDVVQAAVDTIQNGYRFTNIYNVRPVTDTLEEIVARMDDDAKNQSASISMSEEEILIKVEDLDAQQRAYIDLTKDEILAEVDDMARELVGLIDIQAGAVTALIEGGGAAGQMSLTLNLPIMIDAAKRAQLIAASSEAKVNAVYGLVEGTSYYGIKGNASNAALKALWDDAIAAGLIASQIDLTATQISINAQNVKIDGETIINNANKIKAALIDVENLLATNVTVKDKGVLKSANYNGTINSNGEIASYGTTGWAIDHAGNTDFAGGHFSGEISSTEAIFQNDCLMPIVELLQQSDSYAPTTINMTSETGQTIKSKLDGILNYGRAINIDYTDTQYKRVFIYVVSANPNEKRVMYSQYSGATTKAAYYLQCYKDYSDGIVYYEIGNVKNGLTRKLLAVSNGTITKFTVPNTSTLLRFSYYEYECDIATDLYCTATISSRLGYRFNTPTLLQNQSYGSGYTQDIMFKVCQMLHIGEIPVLVILRGTGTGANYELGFVRKESDTQYIAESVIQLNSRKRYFFNSGSTATSEINYFAI